MNALTILLATLALIPQPRVVRETGGYSTATNVSEVADPAIPAEGYQLSVRPDGITIASSSAAGAFYARKTLGQMLSGGRRPCVEIEDAPAYRWRGVHIDDCRHFFGKWSVKVVLDQMAKHKLNVLHWHLTEDQGWRLEIPGYPELLKYAAFRPSSPLPGGRCTRLPDGEREYEQDGMRYGPFYYTEEDVKEVVSYAAERHIMVVPEIELPGHVAAALAAYPEFACRPDKLSHRHPRLGWGISNEVLCLGNDKALKFMEDVLDYVCRVFPAPYVHIGGDECPRTRWKECPKCRKRIADERLKDADALQPWVTRHFVRFLEARGKRAVGWDEYLNGDVPTSAIGMSWRTPGQGTGDMPILSASAAAERGHDLVITTHSFTYFCYSQGLKEDPFYGRRWNLLPLEKVYSFDPCLGVPEAARKHILGGQCCNWSEQTLSPHDLQWKMWPRTCALAEVLWLGEGKPGFSDFRERMRIHRRRLINDCINCAPLAD